MRKLLFALLLALALVMPALAVAPDHTYMFPAKLHSYPLAASLKVWEGDHTWQVDFTDASNGGDVGGVPHPPQMTFGGTFTDANGQRTLATSYASARIVFAKSGNTLTFVSASVHFEMEKTPVNPSD
jgi:hypothetical protein